jgi:hypothetical protein
MAKIKFGMFMTDARGKVGGHVFSKNRSGAYVRTKVTPTNARTVRQTAIRSLLGAISQKWSTISQEARNGFNSAVADWSTTDIFGDSRNPSGKTLFTKLNMNAINAGQPEIETVPAKAEMPVMNLTEVKIALTAGEIYITTDTEFNPGSCVVSATAQLSAGTSFYKGKYRQIAVSVGEVAPISELFDAYVAKFGTPKIGDNISFEIIEVLPNGQASVPQSVKATIVA